MDAAIFTNAALLQYYNLLRGKNKTVLTLSDIMSMGCHIKSVDVFPTSSNFSALHLNDGFTDFTTNGYNYVSFPDFLADSFPDFTEQKDITNDSVSFKVSNVNQSMQTLALGGALDKAQVNIYLTILSPADNSVLVHDLMFSGIIDNFESVVNNLNENITNELTVNLNSVWGKLDVQMRTIAANSVFQSTHPGDEYFSLLGIVNSGQTWKYNK